MVTLIKNGTVVDGTGTPPAKRDVMIREGRIVRLGTFPKLRAETVVDATGLLVTPGFIDVGSRADALGDLVNASNHEAPARQGITTRIVGQCGWSLAPWRTFAAARVGWWHHSIEAPHVWHSFTELFRFFDRADLGTNIATFAGFGALSESAAPGGRVGKVHRGDWSERDERTFSKLLADALAAGALGISARYGGTGEGTISLRIMERFAPMLAAAGAALSVHCDGKPELLAEAVRLFLGVGAAAKISVRLSHFTPQVGPRGATPERYADALAEIERAAGSCDVQFDLHPFETTQISLSPAALATLAPPELAASREFESLAAHLPLGVTVTRIFEPSLRFFEGKSIDDLASARSRSPREQLLEIVRLTRGRAVFRVRNVSGAAQKAALVSPRALIATHGHDDSETEGPHAAFLRWAAGDPGIPLEIAVQRLTGIPARAYRLRHRGAVREGFAADVAVLNAATFEPVHVFVNGVRTLLGGTATRASGGRALRRNQS